MRQTWPVTISSPEVSRRWAPRVLAALPAAAIAAFHVYAWSGPRLLDSFVVGATVPVIVARSLLRVVLFAPLVVAVIMIVRPPRWVGRWYPVWVLALTCLSAAYAVAFAFYGLLWLGL